MSWNRGCFPLTFLNIFLPAAALLLALMGMVFTEDEEAAAAAAALVLLLLLLPAEAERPAALGVRLRVLRVDGALLLRSLPS